MKYKLYEVGGRVRDQLLGLESKDIDYSVVIEDYKKYKSPIQAFKEFKEELLLEGYDVFLETPDAFTIRAMFPKGHKYSGVADFVLSRKDLGYNIGTRSPIVVLGNLEDDLKRRDFTVNAMAIDDSDSIIDPFGGQKDLLNRILRTPIDAAVSFNDDPLRILRAMRFSVTKSFGFSDEILVAILSFDPSKMEVVSTERVTEELRKMFRHNTLRSLQTLDLIKELNPKLYITIFEGGLRLEPTMKH